MHLFYDMYFASLLVGYTSDIFSRIRSVSYFSSSSCTDFNYFYPYAKVAKNENKQKQTKQDNICLLHFLLLQTYTLKSTFLSPQ